MTAIYTDLTPEGVEVGQRIAARVRAAGPVKAVARTFGVAPATVRSWRDGNPPQFRHLLEMVGLWGPGFLEDVFAPVLTDGDLAAAALAARIKSDMQRLEGLINDRLDAADPPRGRVDADRRGAGAMASDADGIAAGASGRPGGVGGVGGLRNAAARPAGRMVGLVVAAALIWASAGADSAKADSDWARRGKPARIVRIIGKI